MPGRAVDARSREHAVTCVPDDGALVEPLVLHRRRELVALFKEEKPTIFVRETDSESRSRSKSKSRLPAWFLRESRWLKSFAACRAFCLASFSFLTKKSSFSFISVL